MMASWVTCAGRVAEAFAARVQSADCAIGSMAGAAPASNQR